MHPATKSHGPGLLPALLASALLACTGVSAAAGAASAPAAVAPAPATAKKPQPAKAPKPVDINSASRQQLMTLPGIGAAQADSIIAGCPYFSKADLATRKVLPGGVVSALKNRIIAIQKAPPKGKA